MTTSIDSAAPVRFHDTASSDAATSTAHAASFAASLGAAAPPVLVASQPKQCPPAEKGTYHPIESAAIDQSNDIKDNARQYIESGDRGDPRSLSMQWINFVGTSAVDLKKEAQQVRFSPAVVSQIRPSLEYARKVLSNAPAIDNLTGKDLVHPVGNSNPFGPLMSPAACLSSSS